MARVWSSWLLAKWLGAVFDGPDEVAIKILANHPKATHPSYRMILRWRFVAWFLV